MAKIKEEAIKSSSKIEFGLIGMIIGSVVWLLSHVLPTEAKVERHEIQLMTLDSKVDKILEDTSYIRGKLEKSK